MTQEHSSFIKTPKQLVVVVVLAFAIPIALIVLLSQLITDIRPVATEDTEAGVLNRIKPVGEVTLAEANAPKGNMTGEQVYQTVCKACHEAGVAGAPKFGDNGAWAPRIKQGVNTLYAHALKGTDKGMPAKGGNTDLADVEVQRAVVFMANKSGATFKEPPAPATPAAAAGAPPPAVPAAAAPPGAAPAAPAPAPPASKPGAPLDMASGTAMMQKDGCSACHAVDKKIVGPAYQDVAAKYKDDKDAAAKLAQKVKTGGSGVWGQVPMPPNTAVPDEDAKALVAWILTLKK
jgi:cytochrome c5